MCPNSQNEFDRGQPGDNAVNFVPSKGNGQRNGDLVTKPIAEPGYPKPRGPSGIKSLRDTPGAAKTGRHRGLFPEGPAPAAADRNPCNFIGFSDVAPTFGYDTFSCAGGWVTRADRPPRKGTLFVRRYTRVIRRRYGDTYATDGGQSNPPSTNGHA
jgi:hypothetical protein